MQKFLARMTGRGKNLKTCCYKIVLKTGHTFTRDFSIQARVSSVFVMKEFLRKKFQAIDGYLLNHAVEGLVVGTLFLVNQPS